jgi:hypothetical protein
MKCVSTAVIVLSTVLLFSCEQQNSSLASKQEAAKKRSAAANDSLQKHPIAIDTFTTFPPEVDGCACYFSTGKAEFKKHTYIYADDYRESCFIKVNGNWIKLTLTYFKEITDRHQIKIYHNTDLTLVLDITEVGQSDETWQQQGTLTLTPKHGQKIKMDIYGECGC